MVMETTSWVEPDTAPLPAGHAEAAAAIDDQSTPSYSQTRRGAKFPPP